MVQRWQEWTEVTDEDLAGVRGICFDIDDTFSTEGKITRGAFDALWNLRDAGLALVPVTGRPAGWCDHFARFWPVDAVVGENGAFVFYMGDGARRRINTPSSVAPNEAKKKLDTFADEVLSEFPHAEWASDQDYREFDLAIDVYEDVEPWPDDDVQKLLDMAEEHGAHAKLSSVHVNVWFGDFDKFAGFTAWQEQGAPGFEGRELSHEEWIYIGDSPNDAPMFRAFDRSVGVANVRPFRARIGEDGPTWVTKGHSGQGFVEVADRILEAREG
jgi:HAD superfamily hydrolase (TIGR01484 family)